MAIQKSPKQLAKLLSYVLGRNPAEFGLVPDEEGFVAVRELLKALNEEEGWRHVRRAGLNEVLLTQSAPPVEILAERIRAVDRGHLPACTFEPEPPVLLYTCVRRRAHAYTVDNGIHPRSADHVLLSADPGMALRIGSRIDQQPVQLTVRTRDAMEQGVVFRHCGASLYLSDFIPVGCFSAPPLPREAPGSKREEKPPVPQKPKTPGTVELSLQEALKPKDKRGRRGKEPDWKKERRRSKRR